MAFPKTMYVKEESDSDSAYFLADNVLEDLVEGKTVIAEYKLIRVATYNTAVQEI